MDDVVELQPSRAHGINQKAKILADEAKGVGWASTPSHSQRHDPQAAGKVKEWLDSIDEFDSDWWKGAARKQFVEANNIVLRLRK